MRLVATAFAIALLGTGAAGAAQVTVRNCAHATADVISYNGTDLVRMVPYAQGSVAPRTSITIGCVTDYCYLTLLVDGSGGTSVPDAREFVCLDSYSPHGAGYRLYVASTCHC